MSPFDSIPTGIVLSGKNVSRNGRNLLRALAMVPGILLLPLLVTAQQVNKAIPFQPLGKLVDAGGHRLHLNCTGKSGIPVVIENGTGDFSFDWSLVQPSVAKFTQVCTYDRAGYAWSEPGPLPRTFRQITTELHQALRNAGVKGPYILVGQSYGGFPARAFARFYPKEVVGMVLVDAVNEDSRVIINREAVRIRDMAQNRPFPLPKTGKSEVPAPAEALPQAAQVEPPLDRLPKPIQQIRLWAETQPAYEQAQQEERNWSPEELALMYKNRGKPEFTLGDIPLIVLTRGEGGYEDGLNVPAKELEDERLRLQKELAKLSSNSKQIIAKDSGHNIHLEAPDLVVDAIRQVVQAAQRHTRLIP